MTNLLDNPKNILLIIEFLKSEDYNISIDSAKQVDLDGTISFFMDDFTILLSEFSINTHQIVEVSVNTEKTRKYWTSDCIRYTQYLEDISRDIYRG